MYDPRDILKTFTLRAHPEVCAGTPETIEARGRAVAKKMKPLTSGERLRLKPEPVPPGTPSGWKAFRFTEQRRITLGTVCGVVFDEETGNTAFVMNDTPLSQSAKVSDPPFFTTRQSGSELQESHILIPPNGYISPELIVSGEAIPD